MNTKNLTIIFAAPFYTRSPAIKRDHQASGNASKNDPNLSSGVTFIVT